MPAIVTKLMSLIMTFIMFICPWLNIPEQNADKDNWNTNYDFVFVHGLGGWGEYDFYYDAYPYWGVATGDMMEYLTARGFNCHAASVTQNGSCWDRTCELYAQIVGTKVDYGEAHSKKCNHARYGEDFTGRGMVENWSAEEKINLLGHSFGGPTIMLLQALMTKGSTEEAAATKDGSLSPLFTGNKADWIYSITTLSSPLKGTTAYTARDNINADPNATLEEKAVVALLSEVTKTPQDGRIDEDGATYSMSIDGAKELCDFYVTNPDCYYFSYATSYTTQNEDGTWSPESDIEILFRAASARMGALTVTSPGGIYVDEKWQQNDGLVNTYSAMAPYGVTPVEYDKDNVTAGTWNLMPIVHGDHTYFMGGITKIVNLRETYFTMLEMINKL